MTTIKLIKNLHDLFVQDEIKRILDILKQVLLQKSKKYYLLLQLTRKNNAISDKLMINTVSDDSIQISESKLADSVLKLISAIQKEDLKKDFHYSLEEISNKIIVFTNRVNEINLIFQKLSFTNVTVKDFGDNDYDLRHVDLIIYDNRDLRNCFSEKELETFNKDEKVLINSRIKEMEKSLISSSMILIHFGHMLYWVNKNRDRVQAANSKFSLYARIKEVIEFINTYRVELKPPE